MNRSTSYSRTSSSSTRPSSAGRQRRQRISSAHGLAEGQFFIDGNKRIALVAMLTFLEINGWRVEAGDPELAEWILDLSGRMTPAELAESLRTALVPV